MKIIGIRPSSFKGDKGEDITGKNIYLTYPLDKGTGLGAERIFVTDAKAADWPYKPAVGDEVKITYNRFGRCDSMEKVR